MPAPKGNKYNQKYEYEEMKEAFLKAKDFAKNNSKCLSLEDAISESNIPYSTYDYYAEKHEELGLIKKDTKKEVIRRINRRALEGDSHATAAIWRMKQLGEKDDKHVDHTSNGKDINIPIIKWVE